MEGSNILHMTAGEGDTSYAKNSQVQKAAITGAKPFVQHTVADLYQKTLPKCFTVADLGCSSGPNSLLVVQDILDTIHSISQKLGRKLPEFQVMLNDLPGNDFNTVFRKIPDFQDKLKKDKGDEFGLCFISGAPGSFYGRLFPSGSLNFVHSSYSLHFLSKMPSGIENKGNIYITKTSPPSIARAYMEQFQNDFTSFLCARSQEVASEGRMVITVIGRRCSDPSSDESCEIMDLIAKALRDLVSEGLIEEAKLDSFNWHQYYSCAGELRSLVEQEGSFHVDVLEEFEVDWDANKDLLSKNAVLTSGQYISNFMRAAFGPMFASHFGEAIIEDFFDKYGSNIDQYLLKQTAKVVNLVLCLRRI